LWSWFEQTTSKQAVTIDNNDETGLNYLWYTTAYYVSIAIYKSDAVDRHESQSS